MFGLGFGFDFELGLSWVGGWIWEWVLIMIANAVGRYLASMAIGDKQLVALIRGIKSVFRMVGSIVLRGEGGEGKARRGREGNRGEGEIVEGNRFSVFGVEYAMGDGSLEVGARKK